VSDEVLVLRAPLSGVVYPLERVPDPVFAQKLVGDGLSIDPIDSTLCAPGGAGQESLDRQEGSSWDSAYRLTR
jgi:phosphotransferase system IIA component